MTEPSYELFYWPTLPGRGEFVRLVLEDAGVPYIDRGRQSPEEGGGAEAVLAYLLGEMPGFPAYAPPVLRVGDLVLAQTPVICRYLGRRHGLAPMNEPEDLHAQQLQLTIADLVMEVHDTHHPLGKSMYYEQQKGEAVANSRNFLKHRLPRFLAYFERVLDHNGGGVLVGDSVSYVDLSMFQTLTGLDYAFPRGFAAIVREFSGLMRLRSEIEARPRIAAYLSSARRIPFNADGIFRRYRELDLPE